MAAFAHRDHFSSTNSREAKNNLCIGVVRLIVEPNAVPPNDNRHSSMSSDISHFGLTFTNLAEIIAHTHDYEYLVDVIGLMTGISAEQDYIRDPLNI
ncbi:DNA-directed primase/polymerase protein [Trifolium repens]|nr:DNA-directed primase/polymerase protein [Trifolium repens]